MRYITTRKERVGEKYSRPQGIEEAAEAKRGYKH